MSVQIFRLLPSISSGWILYPTFEAEVVRFNQHHLSEMTQAQIGLMTKTMQQRFTNDPASSGYWLAMDGATPVGHACGWLAVEWNVPYIFMDQANITEPDHIKEWLGQLNQWVEEMDALLAQKGSCPTAYVEFRTFHKPEVMQRWLEIGGCKNVRYRSVVRFDLK